MELLGGGEGNPAPQAGPPAHESPSVKPQTLDPQLSLQQFQVQGAGWMVNHHTPFRVSHVFHFRVAVLIDLGLLGDDGY